MLAFATVFRDCDESLRAPAHRLDSVYLYIDDNAIVHSATTHNAAPCIFDSCILLCASIAASYPHNAVSRDTCHLHVDIWQHAAITIIAVADAAKLAGGRTLVVVVAVWQRLMSQAQAVVLLQKDCDWEQEAPPPAPPEMALEQEPMLQEPRTA